MHKVGFLAFLGYNYGSTLQAYALFEAIKKLGHDCEVIDCGPDKIFVKDYPEPDHTLKADNPKLYDNLLIKKNFLLFIRKFFKFNENMGSVPDDAILNDRQKAELTQYGAIVCGSDQIWNPIDFWFCAKRYLQFAPEEKRIAYAPSVGWKEIPHFLIMRKPQWGEWISSVKYISTRESSSSALISTSLGRTVETVLDPTLLLEPQDWELVTPHGKYSDKVAQMLSSGKRYLLAYLLDSVSERHRERVRAIARELDLEIVWLTGRDMAVELTQNCAETDPAGFVNLVRNASFVCTDGFHGTCFSLNFSRPFVTFKKDGSSNDARIEDILLRLGAIQRYVNVDTSLKAVDLAMDYGSIQNNLDAERQKSFGWLQAALDGAMLSRGELYEQMTNEMASIKIRREESYAKNYEQLSNEQNLDAYLEKLGQMNDELIVIAAKDTISPNTKATNISANGYEILKSLGFRQLGRSTSGEFWAGYIAIKYKSFVIYEQLAPQGNSLFTEIDVLGMNIKVASSPYKALNVASIKIDGQEYAVDRRGLNIVIFDPLHKKPIDSVAFDTWHRHIPALRAINPDNFANCVAILENFKMLNEFKLEKYLDKIASLEGHLAVFAVKDTICASPYSADTIINGKVLEKFRQIGLTALGSGAKREFWCGYIAIIMNGKVVFEELGEYERTLTYAKDLDGIGLKIISSPYRIQNVASIKINDIEYAVNQRGINIVLYDLKNNCLTDSVSFDTWHQNAPAQRDCEISVKNIAGRRQFDLSNDGIRMRNKADLLYKNPTFHKVAMVVALLRDYGIKNIVISSGTRHAPLVRMFESNEGIFTLYSVVDERSAGYFALGMAAKSNEPVVCVCTSGTAASNYLPPVTEAYYTGVPLIMITTDRLGIFLNNGEDQTIPQRDIYNGVVKKSVSLPEGHSEFDQYQTRRDVTDCILECTHNNKGPVHINIAINDPWIGREVHSEYWQLSNIYPNRILPHVERIEVDSGQYGLHTCLSRLINSDRIMLVYGQNLPPSPEQLANIEKFSAKFNCIILTDLISNLHSSRTLQPFTMLEQISQKDFDEILIPDILISVGGKRMMHDPLTDLFRRSKRSVQHWDVNPDGRFKDFYFKLSKVIECSQDYFFSWFAHADGGTKNNGQYYELWKNEIEKCSIPTSEHLDSHYIQRKFIPTIPANSLLHMGVGLSFYYPRRYPIDPTVEVFCNMGTNGIDGCTSTFMGACAVAKDCLCFLLVGDLSFFYDMNSIWNKRLSKNIRILLDNNNGSDLLRYFHLKNITCTHNTSARVWAEAAGFEYLCAKTKEEFDSRLAYFVSDAPQRAVFFEVMYNFK